MNCKRLVSTFLILLAFKSYGQDYKFIYYLDENLNTVPKDKAVVVGKGYTQGAFMVLDGFPKNSPQKVVSATFTDSSLSTLSGIYRSFYPDMKIESEGNYNNNEMHGTWKYWNKYGYITDSSIYNMGTRTAHGAYNYYYNLVKLTQLLYMDSLNYSGYYLHYIFTDSLKNTSIEKDISVANGIEKLYAEVHFKGNSGIYKSYDNAGNVKTDSVFTKEVVEAEFPGGNEEWLSFLRNNLNPSVGKDNKAPPGFYNIIIRFAVETDGTLSDVVAENDPGYGYVNEAIRVIKASGKWKPGFNYGKIRRSYRRQPISFFVEN